MITLDFSKSFDVFDHKILLVEINKAGIVGNAFKWIGNWLTENNYQCRIKKALSKARNITSRCRQGSTLGPTLFLVFINSLLKSLPEAFIFAYAEDITIVIPHENKNGNNDIILQSMLYTCTKWSKIRTQVQR